MQPLAVGKGKDALCAQDSAEAAFVIQSFQSFADNGFLKALGRFNADILENFIGMMMAVMVMAASAAASVVMMMFVMVVMSALTLMIVVVMMLMMVVMSTLALMIVVMVVLMALALMIVVMMMLMAFALMIVVVVMFMMIMSALALMIVVMMMLVALALMIVVVVMLMMVVMAALALMVMVVMMLMALALMIVVMMMLVHMDIFHGQQESGIFDGFQHLGRIEFIPRSSDDAGLFIVLPEQGDALFDAVFACILGTAENDGFGIFDLVDEEFAEVAGVDPALADVGNGGAACQLHIMGLRDIVDNLADIGELADAGRLNENAVRMVGIDQFCKGFVEIAHQRAADTAGIELGHLNACVLHEAAVDADFAVFIFKEHQLFAFKSAVQKLLDQRGLTCAEEA